jgi:hypothetical protein
LFVIVSITNISKTFPLAYCYITSKLAKSFDFIAKELTKYVFYNCLEAVVICANFTKGLRAAIAAWSLCDANVKDKANQQCCLKPSELLDVLTLQIGKAKKTIL